MGVCVPPTIWLCTLSMGVCLLPPSYVHKLTYTHDGGLAVYLLPSTSYVSTFSMKVCLPPTIQLCTLSMGYVYLPPSMYTQYGVCLPPTIHVYSVRGMSTSHHPCILSMGYVYLPPPNYVHSVLGMSTSHHPTMCTSPNFWWGGSKKWTQRDVRFCKNEASKRSKNCKKRGSIRSKIKVKIGTNAQNGQMTYFCENLDQL